ncbi:MAG: tRNA (N(6)-L-threonylcarbamoyladenosine(37)-C(2))-methylthiotransferase [Thaumarchaeota archaeon]|nr:tRNA (N(6)-L-threonylcarbamoyladenosine(37)-C(2))-methylthiotransferase [Nitrososphaerota archaeon]
MAKIWVEAYGCSASFADSEMISGLVVNGGHTLAENPSDADLNVIVTCSVKDATADKMVHRIKRLRSKPLVVAGCLPKAETTTVEKFSPKASLLGPNSLGKTLAIIDSTLRGQKRIELEDSDITKIGLPKVRLNSAIGIVEIASGCMSECTFCQTKIAKGEIQSFRMGDIVRQVRYEVEDGCKEVWLTSTDNGCYGFDIGTDLPNLVNAVSQIEHNFMIRVGMMNPMYMPRIREGLLESFESPKVFKFIHIPVQSGSNKVLKDMKRGHTEEVFRKSNELFRKKFGRFTVSTDIIVGFPTETEDDFEQTVDLIEETRPDIINLSRYSARLGTKAASMDQIDVSEIMQRSKTVFDMVSRIAQERNQEWVGWKGEVLFDEISDNTTKGRNYAYKPVIIEDKVKMGQRVQIKITRATKHALYGQIAS